MDALQRMAVSEQLDRIADVETRLEQAAAREDESECAYLRIELAQAQRNLTDMRYRIRQSKRK